MSLRTHAALCGWLVGCGDVAALAEPPPEPTAWADGAARAGYVVAGDVEFSGGPTVGTRVFTGVPVADSVQVQFPVTGLAAGSELVVGLRAPRAAGRQVIAGQSRRISGAAEDTRDRWVTAAVEDGVATATLTLPDGWHALHAVVVLAVMRDGREVPAIAGPRMDRGAGVLGVVPVVTRPTQVTAIAGAPVIDGAIDDAVWTGQAGTLLVTSLEGEPDPDVMAKDAALGPGVTAWDPGAVDLLRPGSGTRVWFGWDAEYLYVAASLPDADLWTEYREQDEPLYKQEAFELFVAGSNDGTRYVELQVSARGVTFDAKFATHRKGDEGWDSGWRTAVVVAGTLASGDHDRGWTTEVAVPWAELCENTAIVCPPRPGMRVRINAFRLERPDRKRTSALALSPTRVPDFHAWANAAELELQ